MPSESDSVGTQINLSTTLTGATIYYTLDGSNPTTQSTQGSTFVLEGEPGKVIIVKAIAVTAGAEGAIPVTFTYKLKGKAPAPTASIPSGTITLTGAKTALTVKEGTIYYTIDGSTPTTSSALYTQPILIQESMILKTIAIVPGLENSDVVEYVYTQAGQVTPPVATMPSGEIEIGTKVALTCDTEGATIYYSTDGSNPTQDNKDNLFVYSGEITIMRPVTIKMAARKDGFHMSEINTAIYTVPEKVVEEVIEEVEIPKVTMTNNLHSNRENADVDGGPLYTDVLIEDGSTKAVISAPTDVIPNSTQLEVTHLGTGDEQSKDISKKTGFNIISMYDVKLFDDGINIQPDGEIELGLQLPNNYQNGIVSICYIGDDGTTEQLDTRRSGNMVFAKIDHLSKYAITIPIIEEETSQIDVTLMIMVVTLVAIIALSGVFIVKKMKHSKENKQI